MATVADTITALTTKALEDGAIISQGDANALWLVITGALVFFMHAGFAMLEAGSIHKTSVANIMFKNTATISIGVLSYWFLGFGFAYGNEDVKDVSFIGKKDFLGRTGELGLAFWFFQMVFAATSATIVSGAVAGRIKLSAYFVIATALTSFVYPVISDWIWATGGWLSAFTDPEKLYGFEENKTIPCGTIDFAGSGVVHMTGGIAAFWGAFILGPRAGWTPKGSIYSPHNYALSTLGTMILWFGWFGFNCGSTLVWEGEVAGHVAVTTTLAPGAAGLTGILFSRFAYDRWDLGMVLNCVLAGLVSITAPCATVVPGKAVVIGIFGAFIYLTASYIVRNKLQIDDPVDAIAVHGVGGLWGLISVGLFSDPDLITLAYGETRADCDKGVGALLSFQLLAAVSIFAWVSGFAILIFGGLKAVKQLKLNEEEQYNVDMTEHGGPAYEKM